MFVSQISVFLENRPGALRELTAHLGSANIDIRELSIADTQAFGIIRFIVRGDEAERTKQLLRDAGYTAKLNHVICAQVDDRPNGLCNLLTIIEREKLSVEYMYSCRRTPDGHALMVLRLSEQERGYNVLNAYGVRMLTQEEFDNI